MIIEIIFHVYGMIGVLLCLIGLVFGIGSGEIKCFFEEESVFDGTIMLIAGFSAWVICWPILLIRVIKNIRK